MKQQHYFYSRNGGYTHITHCTKCTLGLIYQTMKGKKMDKKTQKKESVHFHQKKTQILGKVVKWILSFLAFVSLLDEYVIEAHWLKYTKVTNKNTQKL